MMKQPSNLKFRVSKKHLVLVLLLVVGLYVVVPQLGDFRSSWHLLLRPQATWVAAAIGFTGVTYLAGALT